MRSLFFVLPAVALTVCCWGIYGPVLHEGQYRMGDAQGPSSLRPFICVGISYFLIAVIIPLVWLRVRGEKGRWTFTGVYWSLAAGGVGSMGALGIIMSFKSGGFPVYVMPLVFGLAPVVNTIVTVSMAKAWRHVGLLFLVAVVLTALGAAGVLYYKPSRASAAISSLSTLQFAGVIAFTCLTAACWGTYGSLLHKGQAKMQGSRLRPYMCVGLAYFAVAVAAPSLVSPIFPEPGGWTVDGTLVSLGAGACGALGALGIILSFTFGGKPVYVMPLVFGGAPVINTVTTIVRADAFDQVGVMFLLSLLAVIVGSTGVLVFSPRVKPK